MRPGLDRSQALLEQELANRGLKHEWAHSSEREAMYLALAKQMLQRSGAPPPLADNGKLMRGLRQTARGVLLTANTNPADQTDKEMWRDVVCAGYGGGRLRRI